ncbi:MAG TPA: hypothetical protein VFZ48_01765, partial [Candidatus Saccharimonadales bacterium]
AIMSSRMIMILPVFLLFVALYLPGALVLYYAATSLVAIIQQRMVLSRDVDEMEAIAEAPAPKKPKASKAATVKQRAAAATEATVVTTKKKGKAAKQHSKRR